LTDYFIAWKALPVSQLVHHFQDCCRTAKTWFLAVDKSLSPYGSPYSPPLWIRFRYEWGPSPWPLHWCDAVSSDKLDCGALADLSRHALAARGSTILPCQLIRRFNYDAISHWRRLWLKSGCSPDWAQDEYAYHEACALVIRDHVRIWDPTDSKWIEPYCKGYGSTVAAKLVVMDNCKCPPELRWKTQKFPVNEWVCFDKGLSALS